MKQAASYHHHHRRHPSSSSSDHTLAITPEIVIAAPGQIEMKLAQQLRSHDWCNWPIQPPGLRPMPRNIRPQALYRLLHLLASIRVVIVTGDLNAGLEGHSEGN